MFYSFQTLVRNLEDFLLLLFPLTCSMCLIHSILTATLTNAAPKDSTGQMLGMNMAVHSAIRSFAPSIGGTTKVLISSLLFLSCNVLSMLLGFLIAHYGLAAIGGVGIVANILALAMIPWVV